MKATQGLDEALAHQCDTVAVAAVGAVPWPASLEKEKRASVPLIIAATMPPPRPPTVAWAGDRVKIGRNALPNCERFIRQMIATMMIDRCHDQGPSTPVTRALIRMPPKMTIAEDEDQASDRQLRGQPPALEEAEASPKAWSTCPRWRWTAGDDDTAGHDGDDGEDIGQHAVFHAALRVVGGAAAEGAVSASP